MTWLLDTNTLVYALKQEGGVRERLNDAALRGQLAMSAVTVAELLFGAENSQKRDENRRVIFTKLQRIQIVPFGLGTAEHYARIKFHLARTGRPRPRFDLQIAATALDLGATLVTHDGDLLLAGIPGLPLEDWYKAPL